MRIFSRNFACAHVRRRHARSPSFSAIGVVDATNGVAKNEKGRLPPKSYLTFALIAHTATRVGVIDARRRDRTFLRVFSSRVAGSQSNRPRSVNARRRFASSEFRSSRDAGDDSERAVAGVARRDESVNDAARAGRGGSKHSDRTTTLASAVCRSRARRDAGAHAGRRR